MRQIFVDSRDRVSGTSTNFSMVLPQTLALESGHQGRVDDLRLPMTLPTVYFGNSGISFTMGTMPYDVYIPEGQYSSLPDLANAIRNELQKTTGAWTVTTDARNLSMAISCSNAFKFTGGSFMKRMLERPHDYNGSGYNFHYMPLTGLDVCYLCCTNFSHMDSVGPKGASDCLCSIPITVAYGATQHYSMSSSVFFDIPALTTQQLSFQLRDRDYNLLSIVPNISFTLTID
jgi:hypothetical protein